MQCQQVQPNLIYFVAVLTIWLFKILHMAGGHVQLQYNAIAV